MARTGFFHHIGTFFLLAATVLMLAVTLTAPIKSSRHFGLLTVNLPDNLPTGAVSPVSGSDQKIHFGTFGWCITSDDGYVCSRKHVGYDAAGLLSATAENTFSESRSDAIETLTRIMILHPIATVIDLLAFACAFGAGIIGSFAASIVALVATLVTIVVMITDFACFALVRHTVNDQSASGATAHWSAGIWIVLVAAICSLLGAIIVFFTCCSTRMHSRRTGGKA